MFEGWGVRVTPEPVPVLTAVSKMWRPDEPVSSNTGTGLELPTRTSTVGRAPCEVPWPFSTVTGTVAGSWAAYAPDVPTTPPNVKAPIKTMPAATFFTMELFDRPVVTPH